MFIGVARRAQPDHVDGFPVIGMVFLEAHRAVAQAAMLALVPAADQAEEDGPVGGLPRVNLAAAFRRLATGPLIFAVPGFDVFRVAMPPSPGLSRVAGVAPAAPSAAVTFRGLELSDGLLQTAARAAFGGRGVRGAGPGESVAGAAFVTPPVPVTPVGLELRDGLLETAPRAAFLWRGVHGAGPAGSARGRGRKRAPP